MASDNREWIITDHVCAACFGRILVTYDEDDKKTFRCSNCSVESVGRSAAVICACGTKIRGRDAGIRCVKNSAKSPEWPSDIVAEQIAIGDYGAKAKEHC